ncbi:hypothetical protein Lfu02_70230 [Longispora fulva]|uniref:Uncharacterized protein n=1 Tax=Longispora fulva TaxID=619741 RepID=A0A8J7G676_9ACTN|nr:hypothetical protein [Longispora fulva]MBG6134433.1 hypothetical protein [Longispora fulva]GIG62651.1 hypothetical protein Lfu02_70230 [Longispora fulva]
MPDLLWDDVREWFSPQENGSLPDVCVDATTIADWQLVFDLVRTEGWAVRYSVGDVRAELPAKADGIMDRADAESVELRVWPVADVLMIFRMYSAASVDFDVDLRELQGQERLDVLCEFLTKLGRTLGKPVLMTPEGAPDYPLIGYEVEADRVVMFAPAWAETTATDTD